MATRLRIATFNLENLDDPGPAHLGATPCRLQIRQQFVE